MLTMTKHRPDAGHHGVEKIDVKEAARIGHFTFAYLFIQHVEEVAKSLSSYAPDQDEGTKQWCNYRTPIEWSGQCAQDISW